MTKKDFVAIADAFRASRTANTWLEANDQWSKDVNAVASVLATTNPRFNQARWLDYVNGLCGPNGGAVKAA